MTLDALDESERHALAADCHRYPALVEARECLSWGNGPLDADTWRGGNLTGMTYTSRRSGRKV